MEFTENPKIRDFITYFTIFTLQNSKISNKKNNLFSKEDLLEYMLNIDEIDEEIFNKYSANIIKRLNYYEAMINIELFNNEPFLNLQQLSSYSYSIIHCELYKFMLYKQVLDYFKNKIQNKKESVRKELLESNLVLKLINNKIKCKNNVIISYSRIILNFEPTSNVYVDTTNLIKENGNILNL
jgi:hypothetical protein